MEPGELNESFPALRALPGFRHAFLLRVPGLDVHTGRATALHRLAAHHTSARLSLGFPLDPIATAQQVHGAGLALISEPRSIEAPAADGLLTALPGLTLAIYVADCCAVYIADPVRRAIALLHSGRKGTEAGIASGAVQAMTRHFGSRPADLIAQLSPCIQPPHYEVDFAAAIATQLRDAGLRHVSPPPADTAAHPARYYSYRRELGHTGRHLALLMLNQP